MEIIVNYKNGTSVTVRLDFGSALVRAFFMDALDEAAKRSAQKYTRDTGNDWFSEEYDQYISSNQQQYQAEALRLKGEVLDLINNLPEQLPDAQMNNALSQIRQIVVSMPMSNHNASHVKEMTEALKKHVRQEQWKLLEQAQNGEVL